MPTSADVWEAKKALRDRLLTKEGAHPDRLLRIYVFTLEELAWLERHLNPDCFKKRKGAA